jgi:hypothetical protein
MQKVRNEKIDVLMQKTADFMSVMRNASAVATLGTVGVSIYNSLKNKIQNDLRRKTLIEDLLQNDPIIKAADKDKVMEYYATIYHVAPHISADKNTVRDLLHNFLTFDKVDLNSIKTLADAEKSITGGQPNLDKTVDTVTRGITGAMNINGLGY